MQQMSDGICDMVREVQNSNHLILKRLNKIFLASKCESTSCKCKEEVGKCKNELERLEDRLEQVGKAVKGFVERMNTVEQRLDTFQTSLMAVQTDDSKLRRNSSKEQKYGTKENDTDVKDNDNKADPNNTHSTFAETAASCKLENSKQCFDCQAETGAVGNLNADDNSSENHAEESEFIRKMNEKNKEKFSDKPWENTYCFEVLEQLEVKCHDDDNYWRYLAQKELEAARETLKDLEGVHTAIILDISASMSTGSAWTEAKTFVVDYLKGLEEISTRYGLSDEHVALVTFGHETKVQRRLTNKYNELRDATDRLRLGGPSPLYGGMCQALAVAWSSNHRLQTINYVQVFTKMILITDGHLTDQRRFAGPDNPAVDADKAKAKVMQEVEEFMSNHFDIYIVPVGQPDMEFLGLICTTGQATMLNHKDGRQMSRRTYLTSKMEDPLGLLSFQLDSRSWSEEDKKTMANIREKAKKNMLFSRQMETDQYKEIRSGNFPPIGSRVRRGPDWKWREQDSHGPGTVIGHSECDQVWVEWDADEHRNIYRYGLPGYDVLIVDEPRVLKKGQEIAVGCMVKAGKELHDFRPTDTGVVIKLYKKEKKATVRWKNGKRTDCSYGNPSKHEIVVCSGFVPFETEGYVLGSTLTPAPEKTVETQHTNKNKNKQPQFSAKE